MANVAIIVGSIGVQGGQVHLSGVFQAEGQSGDFGWEALVGFGAPPVQVNNAVTAAVVAAAAAMGITIAPADTKTIYGGASAG
jgi:hypothetical protein